MPQTANPVNRVVCNRGVRTAVRYHGNDLTQLQDFFSKLLNVTDTAENGKPRPATPESSSLRPLLHPSRSPKSPPASPVLPFAGTRTSLSADPFPAPTPGTNLRQLYHIIGYSDPTGFVKRKIREKDGETRLYVFAESCDSTTEAERDDLAAFVLGYGGEGNLPARKLRPGRFPPVCTGDVEARVRRQGICVRLRGRDAPGRTPRPFLGLGCFSRS